MELDTQGYPPIKLKPYPISPHKQPGVKAALDEMEANGIISPSVSPYGFPILCVPKKDGGFKIAVDLRLLNLQLATPDSYPIPGMEDLMSKMHGAKFFSTMDAASGYWQIGIKKEDRHKTCFVTPFGSYEFNVCPYGVSTLPSTYTRLMHHVLRGLEAFCVVYFDDLLIFSETFEDHLKHLDIVFTRLKAANLSLKASKCFAHTLYCVDAYPFMQCPMCCRCTLPECFQDFRSSSKATF